MSASARARRRSFRWISRPEVSSPRCSLYRASQGSKRSNQKSDIFHQQDWARKSESRRRPSTMGYTNLLIKLPRFVAGVFHFGFSTLDCLRKVYPLNLWVHRCYGTKLREATATLHRWPLQFNWSSTSCWLDCSTWSRGIAFEHRSHSYRVYRRTFQH